MALCPAHKEKTPSLSIREGKDGKPLVHCFGGCPQDYVIDALRKRGAWHDGLTAVTSQVLRNLVQKVKPMMAAELTDDEKESQAACRRAWDAAVPAENTPAQLYLQCRGIVSTETPLPQSLRYLEAKNALVAALTRPDSDELVGLHVIFLEEDNVGVWKKTKLSYGPVRLGHVYDDQFVFATFGDQITHQVVDLLGLIYEDLATKGLDVLPQVRLYIVVFHPAADPQTAHAIAAFGGDVEHPASATLDRLLALPIAAGGDRAGGVDGQHGFVRVRRAKNEVGRVADEKAVDQEVRRRQ